MKAHPRGARGRTRRVLWIALFFVVLPRPASAQGISRACDEGCASSDLLCVARQNICQSKLDIYGGYMASLGRGVVMHALPPHYVQHLQPLLPTIDLGGYRFGFADRQPPGNAITDCDRTFFGDAEFVENLRAGDLSEDAHFEWLFHEMAHVQQCQEVGGRDLYARMWFGDLGAALFGSLNPLTLHERMPMERKASDQARRVYDAVRIVRDEHGRLLRPENSTAAPGSAAHHSPPPVVARGTGSE